MRTAPLVWRRRFLGALGLLGLGWALAGCGSGFKTVPVSGKIFLDGKPLTEAEATVLFRPDASRGNSIPVDFAGTADAEGNYTLYHGNGQPGVAPGWYKVAVVALEPLTARRAPPTPAERKKFRPGPSAKVRKSLIDLQYNVPASSGIEIEVVEHPAPGAYDLNLRRPAKP